MRWISNIGFGDFLKCSSKSHFQKKCLLCKNNFNTIRFDIKLCKDCRRRIKIAEERKK